MYRSKDGGTTWASTRIGGGDVYGIAFDPMDSKTVYAALSSGPGGCFLRSSDGGVTWDRVARGITDISKSRRIHVGPAGTVYMVAWRGIYKSNDRGETWTPLGGHVAGAEVVQFAPDPKLPDTLYTIIKKRSLRFPPAFHTLAQDPDNPDVLFSGVHFVRDGISIVRSGNGGVHWLASAEGLPDDKITLLRAARQQTVYAVTGKSGVYRSSNSGSTWEICTNLPDGKIRDLAIDPAETARVYLATDKGLFLSSDSGKTWSARNRGLESANLQAIAVVPGHGLFVAGFKGVYRSMDLGSTWTALNEGLIHTDIRSLAVSGGKKPRLYAGTAGGGVFSTALP